MTGIADTIPPLLAAELARQYDMIKLLGRGGMGVVWLARERTLDRLVAIKVLSGESIGRGDVRERFRREARIAARLVHPNIVPLHAFGETPDALYFVMGFVDGETLATRLDREEKTGRKAALRILGEIADALAFAHREGVVHRDVKPENILLDRKSGRALLADFGIARLEGAGTSVTMTGVAVGTPSYMSPEQAVGAPDIDGRSDIYALGVVGYRMLMGRLPFAGTTHQALLAQHAVAKPDDLALAVAQVDRGVARVIMRALEKDPAARWARADDFRDVLQSSAADVAALPEELERIDGLGTKMLIPLTLFGVGMYYLSLATGTPGIGLTYNAVLAAMLAGLAANSALPAARAFGWREAIRALFHPPARWSSWWPRALRRSDDQWDRLPSVVRRFRSFRDGTVALSLVQFGILMPAITDDRLYGVAGLPMLVGTIATIVAARRAKKTLMTLGLSDHEASKVGALPNVASDPVWKNPQFARLLSPEGEASTTHTPRTPVELVRAIEELTARLRSGGLLPDDESAQAARSVRAAIEALEDEVKRLHSDLDPVEAERLDRRLAALASDDDEELRRLLESQRAVMLRLDERRREKEARRDRLRDQLMTLWMQLLELDTRVTRGTPVDPELTSQVRALGRELARADEALSETERLVAPPSREAATPV